jgi:nickel-dependent lactate racemase
MIRDNLSGLFVNQKVLLLIPDATRTVPLPQIFPLLADALADAAQLDLMVALGTHPPLADSRIDRLLGISSADRNGAYSRMRFFNHAYDAPPDLVELGSLAPEEVKAFAGEHWHASLDQTVPVTINRRILDYDHLLIIGPTFPHEVVGFSGGAKYLFPGISGPEMINATHWLGALCGVNSVIGVKDTPVREMIRAAADLVPTPASLLALVVVGQGLQGAFWGDVRSAWAAAADLSAQCHVQRCSRTYQRVLSRAPAMYDELWTAAKAMYKVADVVADGGELILYAPHLSKISDAHGAHIKEIGYHVLPYFLKQWDRFREVPLAVLAHSTHLKGRGTFERGLEKPRIRVSLATQIPEETCRRLDLGYRDPGLIHEVHWKEREEEGILYVPKAGEKLYRLEKGEQTA